MAMTEHALERVCVQCGRPLIQRSSGPKLAEGGPCRQCRRNAILRAGRAANPSNRPSRTCVQCGLSYPAGSGYKYCSPICREKATWARNSVTGKTLDEIRAASVRNQDRACEGCGCMFKPKARDRLRFCSRECASTSPARWKVPRVRVERERYPFTRVWFSNCGRCTKIVVARTPATKVCSARCKRGGPRFCPDCGVAIDGKYFRRCEGCRALRISVAKLAGRQTDTARAAKRARRKARKAAERAAVVEVFDPVDVLERDGWRCHLCRASTPRRLRGTYHPRAPELDHVMPLARGGEHSRANTACACRACNGAKGAHPRGQLHLL